MLVTLTILLLSNYVLAYDGESRLYYDMEEAEDYFSWFVDRYNKTYTKYETKMRFQIFKDNLKAVNEDNLGLSSPVYGITKFFDLTTEEFIQKYTCVRLDQDMPVNPNVKTDKDVQARVVPDAFDWRNKGVVTPVKNQHKCGACWAFAATGSTESAYAMATGNILDLSEQQLVDCDHQSKGCQGGLASSAWQSVIRLGGQEAESDYQYTDIQGQCRFNPSKVVIRLKNYSSYSLRDEEKIKQVLYNEGPLTIAVDCTSFQKYTGGILKDCTFRSLNHAVLLVGYGTESGVPFWAIKNSWGGWGDHGYIKIKRGVNSCGFTSYYVEHANV